MKLGIMGAMPEEVAGIVGQIENATSLQLGGREYVSGRWHGIEVVVVFSRWGKVAASATAAMLLAHFNVDGIFFVGVAGAADSTLALGDVVVATTLLQYDMDASAIPGFRRFEIPLLGCSHFPTHAPWATAAEAAARGFVEEELVSVIDAENRAFFSLEKPNVVSGLIASGDRFVNDTALLHDLRRALPDLRCVEMEGGAVAQVCLEFGSPCSVIRIISDRADHEAPVDFQRFVSKIASTMASSITSRFVRLVAAG